MWHLRDEGDQSRSLGCWCYVNTTCILESCFLFHMKKRSSQLARVRMNPMFSFETYVLWDVWFLFPDKLAFLIKQVLEVKTSYIVSAMKSLPPWEEGDKLLLNVVFG